MYHIRYQLAEWSKIKNEKKSLLVKFYKTFVQLREEMDEGEAGILALP